MCKEAGINRGSLTDLKKGRVKELSASTIKKIANYFDVSIDYLMDNTSSENITKLTPHEIDLITAYRNNSDMQSAVDRLLGINKIRVFRAAQSKDHTPPREDEITKEEFQQLLNAPAVKDL